MATIISITGKGGVGKTTVAALIIKHLKEHASGPILALDADPDSNLAAVLGIPVEKTIGDLREKTRAAMKNFPPGMSKENYIEAGLHEVIVETEKVDLIVMGRSEGVGCYCYINSLLRKFADDLQAAYQWVVMDNEAGLEPLSRGLAARIDHLIVVVGENPLSLDCAERIAGLVAELKPKVGKQYYLINAAREEKLPELRKKLAGLNLEPLGAIPHDRLLNDLVFNRKSLYLLDNTPAVLKIAEVFKKIKPSRP
jgi:CO dehydrogenase maturation factor